jgi:monooxygenase
VRWKNALESMAIFQLSRRRPALVKSMLRKAAVGQLPAGYDVDTHFNPTYRPWDQRMCLIPDGDLFTAIREGRASVVTDHIDTFTETGLRLKSGRTLDAELVISATGLNLLAIGGMTLAVDGRPIDLSDTVSYKGMMLSGVPNFAWTIGYTNASWTLKADLIAQYVCRLLAHMDRHGYAAVIPDATGVDARRAFLELSSGYVTRSMDDLPKQGDRLPWRLHQNYVRDVKLLRRGPIHDDVRFTTAPARRPAPQLAQHVEKSTGWTTGGNAPAVRAAGALRIANGRLSGARPYLASKGSTRARSMSR